MLVMIFMHLYKLYWSTMSVNYRQHTGHDCAHGEQGGRCGGCCVGKWRLVRGSYDQRSYTCGCHIRQEFCGVLHMLRSLDNDDKHVRFMVDSVVGAWSSTTLLQN
jgi:hypothetical protein